jgi:hypothetical protein
MAHTPGPWIIERHENPNIKGWLLTAPVLGSGPDAVNTAAIIGVIPADARLIAAAPDLLTAAKAVLLYSEEPEAFQPLEAAIEELEKAIAKAEGTG